MTRYLDTLYFHVPHRFGADCPTCGETNEFRHPDAWSIHPINPICNHCDDAWYVSRDDAYCIDKVTYVITQNGESAL